MSPCLQLQTATAIGAKAYTYVQEQPDSVPRRRSLRVHEATRQQLLH